MKLRLFVLCVSLLFIFSCKKEDNTKTVLPADNFQPVSAHSIWTYSEFPGSGLFTVTVTGEDTTFNKKKYKVMYSNMDGYSYFRKESGSYYLLYPNDTLKEFLYLKDNGALNDHWEIDYDVNGFPTRFIYKTISMGNPALVGGVVYDQVITVKRDTYVDFGMGDTLMSSQNFSFANNVGLILIDDGTNKTYLASYSIHK